MKSKSEFLRAVSLMLLKWEMAEHNNRRRSFAVNDT